MSAPATALAHRRLGLQPRSVVLAVAAIPGGDHDRQAFPRILLDDGEDLQRPAVLRAVRHEVIRPDVVPILRPVADARAIRESQPAPFRLFSAAL